MFASSVVFPPIESADEDGLLAVGGDLSVSTLLTAYQKGIFPWYNENEPILWWCPDPRFVLFPEALKISRSMNRLLQNNVFEFTINKAFSVVIENCKAVTRKGQDGTWISYDVQQAYQQLHELGYAHSAEAWQDGQLVGGLYGVRLGNIFFGESMFTHSSNASKFAFIKYVQQLQKEQVQLIDCQVYTTHLESLGASMIDRKRFTGILEKNII